MESPGGNAGDRCRRCGARFQGLAAARDALGARNVAECRRAGHLGRSNLLLAVQHTASAKADFLKVVPS